MKDKNLKDKITGRMDKFTAELEGIYLHIYIHTNIRRYIHMIWKATLRVTRMNLHVWYTEEHIYIDVCGVFLGRTGRGLFKT